LIYLDTSVLCPVYWPEQLSGAAQAFIRRHADLAVSDLVEVEFFSALARRAREGDVSTDDARRVTALFLAHLEDGRFDRLPLERAAYLTARAWLSSLQVVARTLDALHLAVAANHDVGIATADAGMAQTAAALGLRVHAIS
jgi:predicted nucleic acid-binding protein